MKNSRTANETSTAVVAICRWVAVSRAPAIAVNIDKVCSGLSTMSSVANSLSRSSSTTASLLVRPRQWPEAMSAMRRAIREDARGCDRKPPVAIREVAGPATPLSAPPALSVILAVAHRLDEIVNQQSHHADHDNDKRRRLHPPYHEAEECHQPGNADQAGDQIHHHGAFLFAARRLASPAAAGRRRCRCALPASVVTSQRAVRKSR